MACKIDTREPQKNKTSDNPNHKNGYESEIKTDHAVKNKDIEKFKDFDLEDFPGFQNAPKEIKDILKSGLDHLYVNKNEPPKFVIIETKYNTARIGNTVNNGRQMSNEWIENHLRKLGLEDEVKINDVQKYLSRVTKDGNIEIKQLNDKGYIIR